MHNSRVSLFSFLFYRGLKNHLICQTASSLTGESTETCQIYSQSEWERITEGSGGEIPKIEYSYYPDLVCYWLALWACYLFAEQQTVWNYYIICTSIQTYRCPPNKYNNFCCLIYRLVFLWSLSLPTPQQLHRYILP